MLTGQREDPGLRRRPPDGSGGHVARGRLAAVDAAHPGPRLHRRAPGGPRPHRHRDAPRRPAEALRRPGQALRLGQQLVDRPRARPDARRRALRRAHPPALRPRRRARPRAAPRHGRAAQGRPRGRRRGQQLPRDRLRHRPPARGDRWHLRPLRRRRDRPAPHPRAHAGPPVGARRRRRPRRRRRLLLPREHRRGALPGVRLGPRARARVAGLDPRAARQRPDRPVRPRAVSRYVPALMKAVAFQGPREVEVVEKPEPELENPGDAVVRITSTGVCGSDLHIFHGRVKIEPGFTIGHEYVGEVVAAGDAVTSVSTGDRVLGCFQVACGTCFACRRGNYHKCEGSRTFGHGATLGGLQGTQADYALVPHANLTLRRVPEGLSEEVALFAGDVMGTGYHSAQAVRPGDSVAVLGLGPVGLCAVQAAFIAGAAQVVAVDTVADRLEMAKRFGATAVHLTEESPRDEVKRLTGGRGVDVAVEAVGDPRALELAIRLAANCGTVSVIGVYAERAEVHMGLAWIKALSIVSGQANVIGHLDAVLALLASGRLDPGPLVTHHMALDDAREAYALYDAREALKIVLTP